MFVKINYDVIQTIAENIYLIRTLIFFKMYFGIKIMILNVQIVDVEYKYKKEFIYSQLTEQVQVKLVAQDSNY